MKSNDDAFTDLANAARLFSFIDPKKPNWSQKKQERANKTLKLIAIDYVRTLAGNEPLVGDEIGYNTMDSVLDIMMEQVRNPDVDET